MQELLVRVLARFSVLALATKLVLGRSGRDHGVGRLAKQRLVSRLFRRFGGIVSLTTVQQQLVLVMDILRIPPSIAGDVVECGCYQGGSTIALSLACGLVGRRLFVCDTFSGLPKPREEEAVDVHPKRGTYYQWEEGSFCSEGGLESVRENVRRYGDLDACRFVPGVYAETLPKLDTDAIVLVFEDADLPSSVEDCLEHLWPKLQPGCKFYCHEPWSIAVVSRFYDRTWWKEHLQEDPPGFFGSGGGFDIALSSSNMGYAIKFDADRIRSTGRRILHAGCKGFQES